MDIKALVKNYIIENVGMVTDVDFAQYFYELGKKDAINSVWHDASEPIIDGKRVLFVSKREYQPFYIAKKHTCYLATENFPKPPYSLFDYETAKKITVKWAYLDDLLPKSE